MQVRLNHVALRDLGQSITSDHLVPLLDHRPQLPEVRRKAACHRKHLTQLLTQLRDSRSTAPALKHLLLASLQLGDLLLNALSLRKPIRTGHVRQTPYRVCDAAQPGPRHRALALGDLPHEPQRPQRIRGEAVPNAGVAHLRVQPPLLYPPRAPRARRPIPLPLLILPGFLQSLRDTLVEPLRRHRSLNRLEVLSEQGQHPVPAIGPQQRKRGISR